MSKEWVNNVATIQKSKAGKLYIRVNKDMELKRDDVLFLEKKTDEVAKKVKAGFITQDEADAELERQGFIMYVATKPPRNEK